MTTWEVELKYIEEWLYSLPKNQYDDISAAITYLSETGPSGGRPTIDRVHRSKYHNLKELRPKKSAKSIRILFIFDPNQKAILLLGGDKAGNWDKWYKKNVPLAEGVYEQHLKSINGK